MYAATAAFSLWDTRNDVAADETAADHADKLFVAINQSLRSIEQEKKANGKAKGQS